MLNSEYLNNLNDNQKEAVFYLNGPLLIAAGAGSGKTKVLTCRIAHIIREHKAFPNQILAVTFTNKAAKEMQNRVSKLLRKTATGLPWLGTFHSISAKLLRKHAEAVGLKSNFSIIDKDDQERLIKNICKAENIDIKKISPRYILAVIDTWKNKGFYPEEVILKRKDVLERNFLNIYKIYQSKLIDLNAADFSDLILHTVKIFERYKDISKLYSKKFKYILVDEYQDTNYIQSEWLKHLSNFNQNICCVGDDDQSIYSWRGAEIKNFLEFDKIYKDTKIIRLEKNYRSTQNILNVASKLIENNQHRVGKNLFTNQDKGELVTLNCFRNVKDEAVEIGSNIEKFQKKYSLNEIAILVRAIFQTREFEERFLKTGIPYRIVGGIKFYERAEIKDCISYLRTVYQPFDDLSFERIINVPKRSIGDTTIKTINDYSKKNKCSLEFASRKLIELNKIKPKTKIGLNLLLKLLEKWRNDLKNKVNHNKLLQTILDESGYSEMLKNKKDLENENKLENIKELLNAMKEFDNLESFLEHVALATSLDQDWQTEKVNLMTMHASKGLEFDVVFLPGWEEGLFPHQKSIEEKGENGLEEERRLAYVGITRAKKIAKISFAMNRFYQGDWIDSMASRFVDELPDKYIKKNNNFVEEENNDFDFNQDIDFENEIKSPGWIRYQKKLNDKYFTEYSKKSNLQLVSNFSGSAGFALILKNKNLLFVDGRYTLQAKKESGKKFNILEIPYIWPKNILNKNNNRLNIGFDPKLFTYSTLNKYFENSCNLTSINENIFEKKIYENFSKKNYFYLLNKNVVGENSILKIGRLTKLLKKIRTNYLFVSSGENVCWLLNIRGKDLPNSPVANCKLIISDKKKIFFFSPLNKVINIKRKIKNLNITFHKEEDFFQILSSLKKESFCIDSQTCSVFNEELIKSKFKIKFKNDPIYNFKSIKNNTEINNMKNAHVEDGVALTKFLYWIKKKQKLDLTEKDIEIKLENFRKKSKNYLYPSFNTIAGSGPNGAIIHYRSNKVTNRKLNKKDLLLVDSGGQYKWGTTDVTRTICFSKVSKKIKEIFTRVLKGHIAVATCNINKEKTGHNLDILARKSLKSVGLDYRHGTGHGVGFFLNVHEGPQSISKNNKIELKEGMIVSNEPGYYSENKFGIRIENLVFIKKNYKSLKFKNLTFAPIDKDLIDFNMLNNNEKEYLFNYHLETYLKISPYLNRDEKKWLAKLI